MVNLSERNPYVIFGIKPGTAVDTIKRRYHQLLKEYHPDTSSAENANEITALIIDAYESIMAYEKGIVQFDDSGFQQSEKQPGVKTRREYTKSYTRSDPYGLKWRKTDEAWVKMCEKWWKEYCKIQVTRYGSKVDWRLRKNFYLSLINKYDEPLRCLRFITGADPILDRSEFWLRLVGLSFEGRMYRNQMLKEGERVYVVREADNPYDYNAILVVNSNGESLGHLKRVYAKQFAPLIDSGQVRVDGVFVEWKPKARVPDYRFVFSEAPELIQ